MSEVAVARSVFAPETIFDCARQPSTIQEVLSVLNIFPDESSAAISAFYSTRPQEHVDILTVLCACSKLIAPSSYLEIGVRRGRSMAIVASQTPGVDLYGFDMWIEGYGGMQNPGPQFVESELRRIGAVGKIELITGDSHQTLPRFFEQHDDQFDLITVDGDHSEAGAREDLLSVLPKITLGGAIVFDDIAHREHSYLQDVWDDIMRDRAFLSVSYNATGNGVAIALPIS